MRGNGTLVGVISGQELKDIRSRADLSNQQLADLLDESLSTVNRWLSRGVQPAKEPKVRERLARWLPATEPDRYTTMSDAAIIAEMIRLLGILGQRLAERLPQTGDTPSQDTPARVDDVSADSEDISSPKRQRSATGAAGPTRRRPRNDAHRTRDV